MTNNGQQFIKMDMLVVTAGCKSPVCCQESSVSFSLAGVQAYTFFYVLSLLSVLSLLNSDFESEYLVHM
jgi:hypothetical protein